MAWPPGQPRQVRSGSRPLWPGPVPAPGPEPHPLDDTGEDGEQPGARRTLADARADVAEPLRTGLGPAYRVGQSPSQRIFKAVLGRGRILIHLPTGSWRLLLQG
jgi:hypothetical protein